MTNHLQKAATGMMILLVLLQMLGEINDASGQNCNLNLRGTSVTLMNCVLLNDFLLCFLWRHAKIPPINVLEFRKRGLALEFSPILAKG